MGRLTKKIKNPKYSNDYVMLCAHDYHILNKLGHLEDLEEQLGCPLDVYIKATIYGVVVDGVHFYVTFNKDEDGYYFLLSNGSAWRFRTTSYKNTWWLKYDRSE